MPKECATGISSTTSRPAPSAVPGLKPWRGNSGDAVRASNATSATSTAAPAATSTAAPAGCPASEEAAISRMPAANAPSRASGAAAPLSASVRGTVAITKPRNSRLSGAFTRKAARQDSASVSTPATTGPARPASAQTSASTANTFGTRRAGKSAGIRA